MAVRKAQVVIACALGLVIVTLAGVAARQDDKSAKVDGAALYKLRCAMCHGPNGDAKMPGMAFVNREWKHGATLKDTMNVIRNGVPGTAMLPFKNKLNDAEIEALARHVRAFDPKLKAADAK